MDETTFTCVDPNMVDAAPVDVETGAKEYNVTRQHSIQRHWMRRSPLLVSSARHFQPRALVHINHKPAAVEALRVGAAKMIGSSDKLSSRERNRSATLVAAIGCAWNAATAGCHRDNEKQEHARKVTATRVFHAFDPINRKRPA